jgi:hypothetical protein
MGKRGNWVRWVALAAAVAALVVFLVAQRQSVDVSYGRSPAGADPIKEGAAGELSGATVPSVAEMTARVQKDPVVRLPGSVAHWDEPRVRAALGDTGMRIIVAPPGLDKAERDRVRAVDAATLRVIGTEVTGDVYQVSSNAAGEWRGQFATGDVTNQLLTLIAGIRKQPAPADVEAPPRRDPTAAELAAIAAELRRTGLYAAPGATLTAVPKQTADAFPGGRALFVALPRQPNDKPLVHYGPALAAAFPGTPVVVMYGTWIEYDGPYAADFADVVGAAFYGQMGDRLSRYDYPQTNVLYAYLNRVTDVRYAGLFDRPLPYQPWDPLNVALPVLPWLFAACVALFLALSVRSLRRPRKGQAGVGSPARLAGLAALAVDMSALTHQPSEAGLTRGVTKLMAARAALDDDLPDAHVQGLLDDAEAELDEAARLLPWRGYRPADYLRSKLA